MRSAASQPRHRRPALCKDDPGKWGDGKEEYTFPNGFAINHRVDRVLSFSPDGGIGTPPTPHPQATVPPPPPLVSGREAHSLAREGMGESQFRRWDIQCGTLYICTLCHKLCMVLVLFWPKTTQAVGFGKFWSQSAKLFSSCRNWDSPNS